MSVNDLQTTVEHLRMTCGQPLNVRERSSDVRERSTDVRKQPSNICEQPSSVHKQPSNVCRQMSKVSHNSRQLLMNPDNSRMSETKVGLSGRHSTKVWMTVDGGDSRLGTCGKLAQSVPFLRWLILVHSEQHSERVIGAKFERGRYPRMRFSPSVGGTQWEKAKIWYAISSHLVTPELMPAYSCMNGRRDKWRCSKDRLIKRRNERMNGNHDVQSPPPTRTTGSHHQPSTRHKTCA